MPDQIEQPPQTLDTRERRSDRDLQRAALRDLVTLATECLTTEAQTEQKHRTEIKTADEKLDKTLFVTEQRAEHLKEQIRQKYAEHIVKIDAKSKEDLEQLNVQDRGMHDRINADWEKSEKELREKLQQATWLADSVLEATQNQLRDESNKGKRDYAAQNEFLDSLENRGGALMISYGV